MVAVGQGTCACFCPPQRRSPSYRTGAYLSDVAPKFLLWMLLALDKLSGEYTAERLKELQKNALSFSSKAAGAGGGGGGGGSEPLIKLSGSFKASFSKDDRFELTSSTAMVGPKPAGSSKSSVGDGFFSQNSGEGLRGFKRTVQSAETAASARCIPS